MAFHWNISVYYSFKIFRRFLLVPIPQLILITDWRLPYLEDGSNIPSIGDSMVYLIRNEFDPWLYA